MEPSTSGGGDAEDDAYAQSFLQNPYYFMFASLAKPDDDTELHWLKVRPHICAFLDAYNLLYLRMDGRVVPLALLYHPCTISKTP